MATTLSISATGCDIPRVTFEASRCGRRAASTGAAAILLLTIVAVVAIGQLAANIGEGPPVAPPAVRDPWGEAPSIALTMTVDWTKIPLTVRTGEVRYPGLLWRHMHFDDWDQVPAEIRYDALNRMVDRYAVLLGTPAVWDQMTAAEWDDVPQPIRAMAYIQMLRYWSGYYQVGSRYRLPRGTVTRTMCAIVMVESWFDHRAESRSRSGNRDLGLAQASDGTREALTRLRSRDLIDFAPSTAEDYFNPWHAARVVAVWLELMLEETDGDLAAAIRAYHVGAPAALLGNGGRYLVAVEEKRRRFLANRASTPAWDLLYRRVLAAPSASSDRSRPMPGVETERLAAVDGVL